MTRFFLTHPTPDRAARRRGGLCAGRLSRALVTVVATAMVAATLVTGCAVAPPPRPPGLLGAVQGSGATTLAAQLRAITDDPAPADARRVIFIGAALHSREDVFDHDVALFDALLKPLYGSAYRAVKLSNLRVHGGERALPLATVEHLDEVFETLAERRRPGDRYVVLFSSHGGAGLLEIEQPARYAPPFRLLSAEKVAAWARLLEPQRAWWVISACHGGSILPLPVVPGHAIVMTAAAADRSSFGCSNNEHNTWFIDALLVALRNSGVAASGHDSFGEVWVRTVALVAARERAQGMPPSLPQRRVGAQVRWVFHEPMVDF